MRHKVSGRTLGRNASHRKAMFRNMAASLIKTMEIDTTDKTAPKVEGRIVTTVPKAKELRPFVEKLITLAKKSLVSTEAAAQYATTYARNSTEWKEWRKSEQWQKWNQASAPSVAFRRRAFAALRDKDAVRILFSTLAPKFVDRPGGYTRILKLAKPRLGDAGARAIIEFVGKNDRVKQKKERTAPAVAVETTAAPAAE